MEHHCHLIFSESPLPLWSTNVNRYLMEWLCDGNAWIYPPTLVRDVFHGRAWRRLRDAARLKDHRTFTAQESLSLDISYKSWGFVRACLGSWSNLSAHLKINKPKDSRLRDTSAFLKVNYRGLSILCTIFDLSYNIEWFGTCRRRSNQHRLDLNKHKCAICLLSSHSCQAHIIFACNIEK